MTSTLPATPVTHISDDRFVVTEWQFPPGAETGWHVHGHDYVVVPLTGGALGLTHPDGSYTEAPLTAGVPYSRRCGVAHNVCNPGAEYLAFLEIEVLQDPLAAERKAVVARFADAWNARDLDTLMDCMAADCAFHAAAGPLAEGTRHQGRDAVRAAYAAIFATFPQAHWDPQQTLIAGDQALTNWRFTGTDTAGRTITVDGCDILHFDGARIALKDSYRKAGA